jgi:hypothetical protein
LTDVALLIRHVDTPVYAARLNRTGRSWIAPNQSLSIRRRVRVPPPAILGLFTVTPHGDPFTRNRTAAGAL